MIEKRQCQGAEGAQCNQAEDNKGKSAFFLINDDSSLWLERCMSEPAEDNRCRGLQRYFYDKTSMSCMPFASAGTCPPRGSNKNNFASLDECETTCKNHLVKSKRKRFFLVLFRWEKN